MKKLITRNVLAIALLFINVVCLAQGPDPDEIPSADPTDVPLNSASLILMSIALLFASYIFFKNRKIAKQ